MTGWSDQTADPAYGCLFESAAGAAGLVSQSGAIQNVVNDVNVQFAAAHGLQVGQAIAAGGDIRFVSAVVDGTTVEINAPFSSPVAANTASTPTVTYKLGNTIPSLSLFDYWSPDTAVHRLICGAVVNELRLSVNSDFHEFKFSGPARQILDSVTFEDGQGSLQSFPAEPEIEMLNPAVIPGNMGQVWLGSTSSRFYTLTQAELVLNNGIEARAREFGLEGPRCFVPGERRVTLDFELYASDDAESIALYEASRLRLPIRAMIQLGQQPGQLFGAYMKSVVAENPEFLDSETRLSWRFKDCRAQGTTDDELTIAFA